VLSCRSESTRSLNSTSGYGPDDDVAVTVATVEATDDRGRGGLGLGGQARAGGGGRRKAGSGRARFQYPDVFGRRRLRGGGSSTAVGRRRAIAAAGPPRIDFRHHDETAQAQQRDEFTFSDTSDPPEVSPTHVCRK